MAKVFLLCGPICSGKTTYSKQLVKNNRPAVLLSVDEITLALFGQDSGENHNEMVEKTESYLFRKAVELINSDITVVFDWGFWTREERQNAAKFFKAENIATEWHYFEVRREIRKKYRNKRNEQILSGQADFYHIDDDTAEKFDKFFEPPNRDEIDVWHNNG